MPTGSRDTFAPCSWTLQKYIIQGGFLTGPSKIFLVSDYIVNLIKKSSKCLNLLTGWYLEKSCQDQLKKNHFVGSMICTWILHLHLSPIKYSKLNAPSFFILLWNFQLNKKSFSSCNFQCRSLNNGDLFFFKLLHQVRLLKVIAAAA